MMGFPQSISFSASLRHRTSLAKILSDCSATEQLIFPGAQCQVCGKSHRRSLILHTHFISMSHRKSNIGACSAHQQSIENFYPPDPPLTVLMEALPRSLGRPAVTVSNALFSILGATLTANSTSSGKAAKDCPSSVMAWGSSLTPSDGGG